MRFLINFLKALGIFTIWGLGAHLIFKFLKTYATGFELYVAWTLLGLLVVGVCALVASFACHMENYK